MPVDGKLVVTETRDAGRSFVAHDRGLPQRPASDLIYRHAFAIDSTGDRLAMGSTTGSLWVSNDGGASGSTSACICPSSPPWPSRPYAPNPA